MESKLLRELRAISRSTTDRLIWARSMCRQASHHARQGETTEALGAIGSVRSEFGNSLEPEVAAWLMLTEGILKYFSGEADLGVDRLLRAYAVAAASPNCAARPTCAAWLALYYFNTRHFIQMLEMLRESLQLAAHDDHQAQARASLVVADAFHLGGRFDLARPWYERARQHATVEGDEPAISAILHNVAAFRACNLKLASALGEHAPEEAQRANMEASSALAYDLAVGTRSFASFLPHVVAQILIVDRKYQEALATLLKIKVGELPSRAHAVHYVDLATCALHLSDSTLLEFNLRSAQDALTRSTDPDDRVYVCCRLASIFDAIGNEQLATHFRVRAQSEVQAYRVAQRELVAGLIQMSRDVSGT